MLVDVLRSTRKKDGDLTWHDHLHLRNGFDPRFSNGNPLASERYTVFAPATLRASAVTSSPREVYEPGYQWFIDQQHLDLQELLPINEDVERYYTEAGTIEQIFSAWSASHSVEIDDVTMTAYFLSDQPSDSLTHGEVRRTYGTARYTITYNYMVISTVIEDAEPVQRTNRISVEHKAYEIIWNLEPSGKHGIRLYITGIKIDSGYRKLTTSDSVMQCQDGLQLGPLSLPPCVHVF